MTMEDSTNTNPKKENGIEQTVSERYYSSGKLLLTGEYFVLDGARSLALPTKFGQEMNVKTILSNELVWQSFDENGNCWLEAIFELPKLRLSKANYIATTDGGGDGIVETLFDILKKVQKLQKGIFDIDNGIEIQTKLDFPRNWGLGTSSTLISNLASWANINAYELLDLTFKGSGYDVAIAQHHCSMIYTKSKNGPIIEKINFDPSFRDELYFIHLNRKQNSREGIQRFLSLKENSSKLVPEISKITDAMLTVNSIVDFEKLLLEHERLVASTLKMESVQQSYFSDYFGQIKSLGAWGGDFVLATGNPSSPAYFSKKGFQTVFPFKELIKK